MKREKNNKDKGVYFMEKEVLTKEEDILEKVQERQKELKQEERKNNRNKKPREKQQRKVWVKPVLIIGMIVILLVAIFSTIFALINSNNEKILSGISINGIDVSGLSKEEAKGKIQVVLQEKIEQEIPIKYQAYESTINPTQIETKYDIDKAVEEAISIGKSNNIVKNNYQILFTLINKKDIAINMTINEEVTKKIIEDIGANLPGVVIESSYYREEDDLIITKGKEGIKIDTENLLIAIKDRLTNVREIENYVTIPVITKQPETINIDKIHEEIYKQVQDAYYTKDPFTIHPEVEGINFNVEEAKALLAAEEKEEYTIKLMITKPKVTINDFGSEAFPDKLATFTTRYDASQTDRTTNLRIACQKLNGKVILPGETFSYNKTLGERSIGAGYKNAKVYENGEVVDGIGGGICQISSTLYNAVLMANLDIVERRNHQFVTSYVPAGRDATVVYGMTDFKFKNTRKYPVTLKASINNGIATVSVYGIKENEEYTVSFETRTIATIPTSVQYEENSNLPVGTEKVKQKGANGVKTETYITKSLKGKVVSRKLLSKDTYNAMKKIVIKGTKGATSTNINKNNNTNTNTKPVETPQQNNTAKEPEENKTNTTNTQSSNENQVNHTSV